ncbi:hypothetical protein [Rhodococcoides corynebacterioides]|uniref:hypothetical protein n=1 Tax=Rhodococcoides corynebacterioides TaxID=53972 RepID=UPI000A824A23|nr:hypothetical protein [Rhodococcus corynebacterioides]
MDPDQWFRLWLAIGQGLGGGLVTLVGGYVGYRLAGRTERNKLRTEALRNLNDRLKRMVEIGEAIPATATSDEAMTQLIAEYRAVLNDDPPPKGTPANVIALELMPTLTSMALEHAIAAKAGKPGRGTPPAALSAIRRSRAECSRWIMKGPPSARSLQRRNKAVLQATEKILDDADPAKNSEAGA